MLNKNNTLVKSFSSVELAITIIISIALVSIAGTIIPQKESVQFYVERYGAKPAIILELLDLTRMYSSYWFHFLLILFCLNLTACTWQRLPGVIATIRRKKPSPPQGTTNPAAPTIVLCSDQRYGTTQKQALEKALSGFATVTREGDGRSFLLHDTGAWSRIGAYIVHLSILTIIGGALIGKFFGYDAFVMIPEGSSKSEVHRTGDSHENIPLNFTILCRSFQIEHYPNGSPKEYRSDLTILEDGAQTMTKSITVNDPLKYKGLTFFQSSYQPLDNEYKVSILKKGAKVTGERAFNETLYFDREKQARSTELGVTFQILETSKDGHGHGPYKVLFDDQNKNPVTMVLHDNAEASVDRAGATYVIRVGQRYSTGLKVVKDPGVWIVYLGCAVMLAGLYVCFFMSHIRLWVWLEEDNDGTKVFLIGKTNKNFMRLDRMQGKIADRLLADTALTLRRV
jgi:cytochrome c biogenesis protein